MVLIWERLAKSGRYYTRQTVEQVAAAANGLRASANGIVAYMPQVNSPNTLVDSAGATWTVLTEEMEDRLSRLGGHVRWK